MAFIPEDSEVLENSVESAAIDFHHLGSVENSDLGGEKTDCKFQMEEEVSKEDEEEGTDGIHHYHCKLEYLF